MKKLLIIGSGGHARPVIATALENGWEIEGIIDLSTTSISKKILDIHIIGSIETVKKFNPSKIDIFIAIGDNIKRKALYIDTVKLGFNLPNLIHKTSYISKTAKLGMANYIGPFTHIGPEVIVGNCCIVNTCVNIEHQTIVENFVQLAPNSVVCGNVEISNSVFIGANATIINNIYVAENVTIGAGAVIIQDILEKNKKIVGVPGRIV
jgi:sugar O-acyltransferase (sialic acid O-acetyltransferase NeuD family)